jgi:hypothetical protein
VNDDVLVALIAAAGSVLSAVMTVIVLIMVNVILNRTRQTHELVNSKMTELLAASAAQAHAEGILSGEQAQRDRMAPPLEETK